jgi:NAD(P)-dependent dehydrogenase (short-subunit alcohol dehydrogenase family)
MSGRFDLSGKRALVSGASRGMGRAIALGLAQAGADVAVAARHLETLEPVAAQIRALGREALVQPLDVSRPEQIPAAVQQVEEGLGPIDILFNVAGTNVRRPIAEIAEAEYDQVMDVNIKGAYFLSREVGKGMIARQQGKVVNIASVTSAIGLAKVTAYACSKGALAQLTRGLAVEWGPHHVQVNAIAPGFILTDFNRVLWEDPAMLAWAVGGTPAGRLGRPEDVVGAAVFLSSPASDFITGQVLFVDGGYMAGRPWPL